MRIEEKGGRLVVVDFDDVEACKIACRIERDGIAFYEGLAGRSAGSGARRALGELAREERDHLDFFRGELERLRAEKEDRFEEDDLMDSLDYGVFQPYRDLAEALDSPAKALRLAQLVEERTVHFYEACRARVGSGAARRELGRIIEEERAHARRIGEMREAPAKA